MIKLLDQGEYALIETITHTKVLTLNGKYFAWINAQGIGEILVASKKHHKISHIVSLGKFRLYEIHDEPKLTDLVHLELFVGEGKWQGFLLPTGLPTEMDKRNRIIPTNEIVTKALA